MEEFEKENITSLYWKDITTPANKWRGIEITVNNTSIHPSTFHIESCSKQFFSLTYENEILFWARQHYTHYGVALIKNNEPLYTIPIISHIRSREIEKRKDLVGVEKFKSWSKFFIQSLNRKDNHFFTEGKWLIAPFSGNAYNQFYWDYHIEKEMEKSEIDKSIFDALNQDTFQYLSWFNTPHQAIRYIGLKHVDDNDGRLKWWQKKAKEGTLPPILIYYISGLDGYVVIDGHYRLRAAQLENILPDVIVLSTYKVEKYPIDPNRQQNILKSLKQRQNNIRKIDKMDVTKINNILIDAYKKEELNIYKTSKSIQVPIECCLQDMMLYLDKIGHVEYAQRLFDETDGEGW